MAIEKFQLTRSVGSVTDFTIKWVLHRHNFNSHAPWGAWRDLQLVHYYVQNFNSHAPWGAWPIADITRTPLSLFQLTRSVGSVTRIRLGHTNSIRISTHTLRGERDSISYNCSPTPITWFQLTRSVGSVTSSRFAANKLICISTHTLRGERDVWELSILFLTFCISTHTLRGERDFFRDYLCMTVFHFNSHAPWGAWHMFYLSFTANIYISTHTLRGERDTPRMLYVLWL